MNVLRTSHIEPNSIRRVPVNGYSSLINYSNKSMEWITYCEKITGISYRHPWSVGGEMYLKKSKAWLQTTQPTSGGAGLKQLCKLCRTSPPPAMGARFTVFWACRPCGPAGWLALLLTKAGDVETNPGPTTLNKKVWICDICHKQIHVRKQISIR